MTEEKLKVIICPKCGEAINVEKLFEIFSKINDVKKEQKEWQMRYDGTLSRLEETEYKIFTEEMLLNNTENELQDVMSSNKKLNPDELKYARNEIIHLKNEINKLIEKITEKTIEEVENNQIKDLETELEEKQNLLADKSAKILDKSTEIEVLQKRIELHKENLTYLENQERHLKVQKATYLDKLNDIEEKIHNLLRNTGE